MILYCSGYNWKTMLLLVVTDTYSNKICSNLGMLFTLKQLNIYITGFLKAEGEKLYIWTSNHIYLLVHLFIYIYFFPLERAVDV